MRNLLATKPTTAPAVRINALAGFDRTAEAYELAERFALKPADHQHVLGRQLTLALAVHGKIRVVQGVLHRRLSGGGFTLCDSDGLQVVSVDPRTVIAWSADLVAERLETATLRALRELRAEAHAALVAELDAGLAPARTYAMAA
ncbi:hypothetical protein [Arthrobacter sp. STN4]|uniref:hypothetical protein n=1 Tax=Arthrobacter sp. STN4 TaxID=2923276 RepID=UPI002119CC40|nr:hypothetical protein [Arthrobacter sp. STN4]MCQ9162943.1 hypothetical protein [Arthrobacter sp. STN4]